MTRPRFCGQCGHEIGCPNCSPVGPFPLMAYDSFNQVFGGRAGSFAIVLIEHRQIMLARPDKLTEVVAHIRGGLK